MKNLKRIGTTLLMIIGIASVSDAQIVLPYTNGFDTNSEIADWILYRKGSTLSHYTWQTRPSSNAVTPPNFLWHDYPVSIQTTQMTDDWFVSKSINFANGARLSLKAWVYTFSAPVAGDSIEIYVLKSNQDPSLATKIKVASLRALAANTGGGWTPVWKDTANIIIPPTAGTAHLAIRYTTIQNWFTVGIDDLKLIANPTSGIDDADVVKTQIQLYPNPANSVINWGFSVGDLNKLSKQEGVIINLQGRELKRFPVKDKTLNIDFLSPGMYYMKIDNAIVPFTKL